MIYVASETIARINGAHMLIDPLRKAEMLESLRLLAVANPKEMAAEWEDRKIEIVGAYGYGPQQAVRSKPFAFADGNAIIPVHGMLINRFSSSWGFVTGYNFIRNQTALASADPEVQRIIYDVNSFGGMVAGCFETAEDVRKARSAKATLAVFDAFAFSAAYAIGSAPKRVVMTPSGGCGSIGVVAMHVSMEKALEQMGVEITFIYAGEHKVDGNPYEKLSASAKANLKAAIDRDYSKFVSLVAKNRGMDEKAVRKTEAATFQAEEALSLGLINAVMTATEALADPIDPSDVEGDGREAVTTTTTTQENPAMPGENDKPGIAPDSKQIAADAVKADRARQAAILALPEAKGREATAQHLALSTDMDAEAAKAMLATIPLAAAPTAPEAQAPTGQNAFKAEMDKGGHPNVGADAAGGGGGNGDPKREAAMARVARAGDALFGKPKQATH